MNTDMIRGDLKLIFEGVCDKVKALVEKQVESVQKNTHKLPKVCYFSRPNSKLS